MRLTELERRWAVATLEAFAPVGGPGLAPSESEVDYGRVVDVMTASVSARGRAGLRLGVWLAALAPAWMLGRPETIDEMPVLLRAELLSKMLAHRHFAVRGLTTFLKLGASMALLQVPRLRADTHYDSPDAAPGARAHAHRALPVVAEASP